MEPYNSAKFAPKCDGFSSWWASHCYATIFSVHSWIPRSVSICSIQDWLGFGCLTCKTTCIPGGIAVLARDQMGTEYGSLVCCSCVRFPQNERFNQLLSHNQTQNSGFIGTPFLIHHPPRFFFPFLALGPAEVSKLKRCMMVIIPSS